jgi:DNA-binding beta-propeller fold protein YncE
MQRKLVWYSAFILAALAGTAVPVGADVIVTGYEESSILRFADDGTSLDPIVAPGGMSGVVAPSGITLGADGYLYVSNQTSVFVPGAPDAIVKIDPATGTVTPFITLASGYVPAGLRFGPADGYLYVSHNGGQMAGEGTGSVDRYDPNTGAYIDSVITNLTQPTGLLFDAHGRLYVSNFGDGAVVKYHPHSGRAKVLVPFGSGGLVGPAGLQIGPDGHLYVVDLLIGAVHVYDRRTGASLGDFIAPGGALNNQFPSDLLFDGQGNLLVADLGSSFSEPTGNVLSFDASGNYVDTFAQGIFGASQLLYLAGQ